MSTTTPDGLTAEVRTKIRSVFKRYPEVTEVILYGSRAKGTAKPQSDIDLTLVGDELTNSILARIESELEDLLLPYKIDLSVLANIDNESLLEHIRRVGRKF